MENYDFLLKLPNGGFLGLVSFGQKQGDFKVLEIPNPELVMSVDDLINNSKIDEREENTLLLKERVRTYGLTQAIINTKEQTHIEKQTLKSFCLVSTKEVKKECLVSLKTLRLFHDQPVLYNMRQ